MSYDYDRQIEETPGFSDMEDMWFLNDENYIDDEGEFARFETAVLDDEDWDEASDAYMAGLPEFLMDEVWDDDNGDF